MLELSVAASMPAILPAMPLASSTESSLDGGAGARGGEEELPAFFFFLPDSF